jgi:cytochrome P450
MEAGMRELVDDAIDEFIEDGETDFATEVADRIPAVTTLRVLGLPLDAWRRWVDYFHHKVSDKLESSTSTAYAANNSVIQEMTDHVRDRRENPRDDGLSQMVNTPVRGELVSIEQAVENLSLVLLGGLDTTAALLTNTALYLAENPADRERLRADRSLMTSACEEFLRFFSPVQNLARTVRHATTFKGVPLDGNERVLLSWAAANRDPSQFEDPDTVKLDRFPNRHQAFGLGVHRCAGSHLARAEWRLVFEAMLDRLPDWSIDREQAVPYKQIASDNGWHEMPMTFTPGTRVRSAREEAR